MFGKKNKIIKEQQMTIEVLKNMLNSLEEDLAYKSEELYKLSAKKKAGRPKKEV